MSGEALHRAAAGIALAVGVGAYTAPGLVTRVFGVKEPLTGGGDFGWRLRGSVNLVIGVAAWRGDEAARRVIIPVQILDQLVFAHSALTGRVPRPTAAAASATSAALIALSAAAHSRD